MPDSSPDDAQLQAWLARLRSDPLLAGAGAAALARLLGEARAVQVAAGATLYEAGHAADALYLLLDGRVQLRTPAGQLRDVDAPHCGEEAATALKHYVASAHALDAVEALRLPRAALADLPDATGQRALLALGSHLAGESLAAPAAKPKAAGTGVGPRFTPEAWGWLAVLVLPALVGAGGMLAGWRVEAAMLLAILSATVLMWLFSLADEFVPPLLALGAVLMMQLVPLNVALAGFASATLMTLVGVYALASLIAASGLSYRLMLALLSRLPDTPFWQQCALLVSGYALSPIMPSGNARLTLLLPFYRDMAGSLGLKPRSSAATALMAALFGGAMLWSPMFLTSKSSNLTVYTMLPAQVQHEFQGLFWLVAAAVAAVLVTLVHFVAVRLSFPAEPQAPLPRERLKLQLALLGPVGAGEKAALLGFLLFVGGAATTPWHQIHPAWLAAFILVGLLLTGLVGKKDFQQKIDWPMIFFLLSLDGLSRAITHLGLDQSLAAALGPHLGFLGGRLALFIPVALAVVLAMRLVLPITAGMVVSAVVLLPVAAAQDIHPWVAVFLTAMFSDMWFKPYQSSQYLQVAGSNVRALYDEPGFLRYNQVMNAARVLAAFASIPYWQWLGLA